MIDNTDSLPVTRQCELLHVPYIVLVSAASLLVPPRWKGRPVFSDS